MNILFASNCRCGLHRKSIMHKWRLRNTGGKISVLSCLTCRWVWRTRRKYALNLPPYKSSYKGKLDNLQVLDLFKKGLYSINPETGEVISTISKKKLKSRENSLGDGYLFVTLSHKRKQKTISVHVLQWMVANNQIKPDGYDVHHINSPPRPLLKDNSLQNLVLVESSRNRSNAHSCEYSESSDPF